MNRRTLLKILASICLILIPTGLTIWDRRFNGEYQLGVRWEVVGPIAGALAVLPWLSGMIGKRWYKPTAPSPFIISDKQEDNNTWYSYNSSDTVIVFIHGILSNSRSCWLNMEGEKPVFWPELITSDLRFNNPAIFLAGYYTDIDSGFSGIRNCADEVFSALGRTDEKGHAPVLEKPRIIFVCHSMGGIVARYFLQANYEVFKEKEIGLVLIASPSYGAKLANRLSPIIRFYNHSQANTLMWGSDLLQEYDDQFKELIDKNRIPKLRGIEFYENHFIAAGPFSIFKWKWIPFRTKHVIVTKASAGKYFGAPKLIPNTDHFSCVKPDSIRDSVHVYLYDFMSDNHLLPSSPEMN
ncbi:hypothetical protein Pan241w_35080 [Gimesia alba]|uniref:DUF676 domain-containing protein n=1 Tax=Gimesia alba TaxID=2527973 RepID=A0A517RHQ2_9PLAN|nr:alpha/beta hydrolase [Gimesia alba]QDT43408.1 hypothetical protein Pan241w_35080 [Gimesia alba]